MTISIQCRIHGTFETGTLVLAPEKSSSTLPNSFFFYQIDKLISFELIHWKQDILDAYFWIKYDMIEEKQRDFIKKHATAT